MNPNNIETVDELSPMQQAMLFHSLMAPGSGVYVLQMSLRLTGRLEISAFERAWRSLVARHSILRTAFFWEDLETPRQVAFQKVDLEVERTCWRDLSAAEQGERLADFLAADRARGFELTEAPLFRLALVELAEDVHQLVWTQHHLVVDGWSQGLVLRELLTAYAAFAAGREPVLPPAPGFHEYLVWLQRQDLGAAEAFWRQSLEGFSTPTFLAVPEGREEGPHGPDGSGARRRDHSLSGLGSAALREVARRRRLTLNTMVQGAWALLLAQESSRDDVAFGVTVAGRPADLPGVESIAGPFLNTLALRVEVAPEHRLHGWLAALQEQQVAARRHEHAPLVEVQRWSGLPAGVALFDHILVFENVALPEEAVRPVAGLKIVEEAASALTNYPLNVIVLPGSEIVLSLRWDAARCDAPEMVRLLERLARVLTAFAGDGDPRLGELPLLLPAERQELLHEWSDTAAAFPREATVHDLFARQAARRSGAVAVELDENKVTWDELRDRAGQLARRLVAWGVRPEERVGVLAERSPDVIATLLGILQAGGAYLPLDPALPAERLAWMLRDAGASRLVARGVPRIELPAGLQLLDLESGAPAPAPAPAPNIELPRVPAEALAYVMYTSGSTGTPKGVAVTHRNVVRLVRGADYADMGAEQTWLQAAPASFDASTLEIWAPLLNGGRLVLLPGQAGALDELAAAIAAHGVTAAWLTAGLFHEMVDGCLEGLRPLTQLLTGGDVVSPDHARRALSAHPGLTLIDGYGPTEGTTFTCCHRLTAASQVEGSIPIGRPIANARVYVLDRHGAPVPVGAEGELSAGGEGLARGYLGRPDLTAERFVPDAFGEAGSRLYRTGDRVRRREDGLLEFLGRFDNQVKIRGFRIEPGEIEAALAGLPGVREAVVVARADRADSSPGDRRLVAYVVGDASPDTLREDLRARLPAHLVPAAFVVLPAFPLTPNGKVDRKALPAPESTRGAAVSERAVAPSGPVEELVAAIWADVLGLDRVGAEDNFFALGGHSLLATRVVSRLRATFGIEMPMRCLFDAPTVSALARVVQESWAGEQASPLVPVPPQRSLPLSFAQQRLWFLDRLEPGSGLYNIPLAVRLRGAVDPGLLRGIFAEVVRRHEVLRTTFDFDAQVGEPVQVIAVPFVPELPVIDLAGLPDLNAGHQARSLTRAEAQRPFDLRTGPLLRLTLLRLAAEEHVLLITLHHIISDGWSTGVLLREIGALGAAFVAGRPSPLPELPVQYADFAVWQRGWLQGAVLDEQLGAWTRRLAGAPRMLDLPTDRPRPAVQTFRGSCRPVALPPALAAELAALCRQAGATPFMALLAVWGILLGRHAGQDRVVVGVPVAGRNRREIEALIGFFVNTLALHLDLGGDGTSFTDLLARTREVALDAFAHQDLPFERLVEAVVQERDLAVSPLFQTMFSLQNLPAEPVRFPGLELAPIATIATIATESEVAKFDLSLYLAESAEGILGGLEFNTGLFDGATAERLAERFARLAAGAVADPACPLGELPLLGPAEREQLLAGCNATAEPFPEELCIHELIAAQVARTPEAPAVSLEGERWSYRELWDEAGRFATQLAALGVGPEVLVAVRMERSPRMLAALLGVLRTGGAYVPLDPMHPPERLAFILEDARTRVVVTDEGLQATGMAEPHPASRSSALPENLAYLIYTSGSTGRPKGVGVCHRGVVNFVATLARCPGMSAEDVVAAVITPAFDMAVTELLLPLTVGARIELVGRETAGDAACLAAVLDSAGATYLQATPATWTMLVEGGWRGRPGLKALSAGEALPRALVEKLLPLVGELWNAYGPTEATVLSAVHRVAPGSGPVPIGRPLGNTAIHLWGRWGELVPPGAAGELLIGGAGLARGYYGRPDLTAERFVPDPFGDRSGARLYRTGDLARRRPDAHQESILELLGRIDFQVKIRGFRIEPGEIEAVLATHPDVRECLVLARRDLPRSGGDLQLIGGDLALVAYLVGDAAPGSLREHLRARLPGYMVPAAFVALPALPRTANGKVDRQALPAPGSPRGAAVSGGVAPSGPVEEALAAIWTDVLSLDRVGAEDNFFALGGHSLLAARVISRLRTTFEVDVPLRDLFEAPTLAGLAARVEAAQRILRSGTAAPAPPLVPLAPVLRRGPLPLSFAQQRLWFIDQLEPGSPVYNIPVVLRAEGPLDAGVLARALGEILCRHEALRTVFALRDGAPVQVIQPAAAFSLPLVDLSGLPESRREPQALALAGEEARRPFDLGGSRGEPLLRGVLLRLADSLATTDHVAALTMHHIASDGWSMGILVREVMVLYMQSAAGRPSPLPELPVQYADFAVWQRSWLQGEVLENELAYWRRQLAGLPPLLELPADRPRPAVQSFQGASRPLRLPAGLTRQVQALSRFEGATLFMVLLAGFQALLARTSGQEDLAVGSPVAGRNRMETEGLIGFFVNTLVLRGDLTHEPSFRELLGRTRETALAAYLHQDVPFEKLVEELAPERSLAQTPLFQVMLVLQNAPLGSLEIQDLRLRPLDAAGSVASFDLTVSFAEREGGLNGTAEYATDLFDGTTIDRLLGYFERLLAAALEAPELPVVELPLLSAAERGQILIEWNDTRPAAAPPSSPSSCISVQELFAAQARRTPDAVAVTCGSAELTYAELAERAGCLARHLRRLGVGPDVLVGLLAERSLDTIVGMVGILQAGGAYVPLDPAYPAERLAFMLDDSRASVVLTQEALRGRVPAGHRAVVLLDGGGIAAAEPPETPEIPETVASAAANLASVIYTSGSTGRPKGVLVPHQTLAFLVGVSRESYILVPEDRILQLASLSFDTSTEEIWMALTAGATLVLRPDDMLASIPHFLREVARLGITVLDMPTALWHELAAGLEAEDLALPRELRLIILGGEEALADRFALWQRHARSSIRLINTYGPTETTIVATHREMAGLSPGSPIPIGRPIPGARVYVLDPWLTPVPPGVRGELWIGGSGVSRGYLGRPGLTAERFVPDPFGDSSDSSDRCGGRLYRTGDLAVPRPDGDLLFAGRADRQIKMRGYRIEPGEIEAALRLLPAVLEAVADTRAVGDFQQLTAWLVPCEGSALPAAAELRAFLRERLPDYMVPAAFVTIAELPLTPNGKVDRRALPAPGPRSAGESYLAPRTPAEEVVAGIWAELLGLERVGAADHFFALGGHSLLATRVVSRLRGAFEVELPLRDLFEAPTVGDLAARVEAAQRSLRSGTVAPVPPLVPVPREGPLPLSFAQQRLWFLDQLEPGSPLYNMPVALRAAGPLDAGVLALCLGEIERRHESLRTVFSVREGTPVQRIMPAVPFVLPLVDLSDLPDLSDLSDLSDRSALALAQEEAGRPFDLTRGPLLRGVLLRLAEEHHVVALTLHHIASDGWSMGILVREVVALYAALAEGKPSPLPELPVQYADFAVWQCSWLRGEVLEGEIAYWRRQLAGLPALLDLPTDRPRPAIQSYRGASRPVLLPAALLRESEALARREGATLFMVLLAAFQTLLARTSGQDDLAVGSPVAGRNRMETEGLIGFFVNTLVLRGDLSGDGTGDPSFRDLLGRVRETALAAYLHQDVPFEKLVQELAPERNLAQSPLFQVMLVLQNAPEAELRVAGLTFSSAGAAGGTAKFDLTLSLGETSEGLAGALEYAADLFDPATVDRFLGHLGHLLAGAVAEPGTLLSELRLMDEQEERQLLQSGRDGSGRIWALPTLSTTVHDLFLQQAGRAIDRTAAVGPQGALTYGELIDRSGALAGSIQSVLPRPLGFPIDCPVALLAGADPLVLVGMLGILRAGAGFVPLDPRHPDERLAWILEDAACEVLVTERRHVDRALGLGLRHVVCLEDAVLSEPVSGPVSGAVPAIRAGDEPLALARSLAYIVYTSGSTGRPKGVQISHQNLVPMLRWGIDYLGLGASTRVLQSLSFCFDFGIFEHLTTLLAGGTLVFPGEAAGDPFAFAREIVRRDIDTLHTTPVFARELAAAGVALDSLEVLHLGGEALTRDTVFRLRQAAPRAVIYNGYGPTEATVNSSIFRIGRIDERDGSPWPSIPIGRPSADNALYILDRTGRPVPFGVRGDLHVGGIGVARGYLNRPDLTAERFVPDPFGSAPGGRLYRTGDLVRYLPGGNIEFLGRLDHQVKIRGFRIELGEIEAALLALPGVREAVVVARQDREGNRLVAYVVEGVAPGALRPSFRERLRERLPEHMVPSAFVTLAALPLTPNGKVDRKALPAPERQQPDHDWVAPRTPVEEVVAGIWAEVLGLERVGAADHFFALGGHSLLATQVMSRLRSVFGIELPLRELFEDSTVAGLAARVEAARSSGAVVPAPPLLPLSPASRQGPLPLSFAQQRLWFIDQLEPGSPLYNMPVALRIEGPLDAGVLALCLGEIVRRHESLRTVFAVFEGLEGLDGTPVQVIRPAASFVLPLVDLSGLPESRRDVLALRLAGEEAGRPFDLARGPLLRGVLLRLGEEDHAVALTMHHIAGDGWSMGTLVREVVALYAAFAAGLPSPLPELPVQYADFAVWQHSRLYGEVLENEISFWRRELAGLPPLLDLPTDRPRPAAQSYRGASRPVHLPAALTREAEALGRREGATLFMVLLAGFQALLAQTSGQDDLAVGSPVAGRNQVETEGLIGFFVNTLVLRGDLSGGSFRELLGRTRETALAAYLHQDVPFEKLVQELAPERNLSHSPLFQVMLALQNAPAAELRVAGLTFSPVAAAGTTAKFDLTLSLGMTPDGLAGAVEYAADLFDPATVDRFLGHLAHLLAGATADPETPLSELRLMDAEEEQQLLQRGLDRSGRTWVLPTFSTMVHDLFLQQAGRTPDRIAAAGPQGALTHGELMERSTALASQIRSVLPSPLGFPIDRPVALLADADPLVLAGMLGILQAGAGFVPLDPRHPEERLAWTLQDAACEVLVTQRRHLARAVGFGLRHVLCLEDAAPSGQAPVIRTESEPRSLARSLAYIVYTSGSTGRPKGVQVSHENLVPMLRWGIDYLGLEVCRDTGTRVLQSLSFCFDFGIFEHLTTVLAGGTLVFPGEAAGDPLAFAGEIVRQGIDTLHTTPVFARELAAAEVTLDSLEILHLGGEALTRDTVARLHQAAPRAVVFNGYGPTEATVNSSIFRIDGEDDSPWPTVPIGRPSADNALYLLDRTGRPVPFGARGNLHVGGIGVARGYLNRPDLTAERFVPDPFGSAPGGRLYRTGDSVRYLPGGNIEFLGRLDHQVKIRGFRIELGEIEAVLLSLPGVREAVVVAPEHREGNRLIAYVVGDAVPGALREQLRERLPEHMVPSAFVMLAALPLTPNGKVDRKALPAPERQRPEEGGLAPCNPVEEVVAGIWAEVLGLERVGASDHFFALGGHSLLATQVLARLRSVFGIEMPLRDLFEAPVLSALAARVQVARRVRAAAPAPPLVPDLAMQDADFAATRRAGC
jgi:amino acid adenylation domain-containing protein